MHKPLSAALLAAAFRHVAASGPNFVLPRTQAKCPGSMSETIYKIIPVDPDVTWSSAQLRQIAEVTRRLFPDSSRIEPVAFEHRTFVDCGGNLESIKCPECDCEISLEDWHAAMDFSFRSNFADLLFRPQCCGGRTSLNDLVYAWPCAFAWCMIAIYDPNRSLNESDLDKLTAAADCRVRAIIGHV